MPSSAVGDASSPGSGVAPLVLGRGASNMEMAVKTNEMARETRNENMAYPMGETKGFSVGIQRWPPKLRPLPKRDTQQAQLLSQPG